MNHHVRVGGLDVDARLHRFVEDEALPGSGVTPSDFWAGLERQISIRGTVTKLSREESETYFKSRPIGSRLGAWVSRQSSEVPDRAFLEKRLEEVTSKYGENPPLPPYWGGYLVEPITIEFWQGRPNRLHDRFRYLKENGTWRLARLSP